MSSPKKYLTIKETAEMLGVTPLTLRNWDKSGKLKAFRNPLNNYRAYKSEDVRVFLDQIGLRKEPIQKEAKEGKSADQKEKIDKKRKRSSRLLICSAVIFLILAASVALGTLGLADTEIKIWPKTENISLERSVVAEEGNRYDFAEGLLPGQTIKINEAFSMRFSSTGKTSKEEKATGVIRIYNDYSTAPQALTVATRFISSEGKLFRSLKYSVVPGQYYEEGELVPGFVDIEVIAAEPGESYNIPPSGFFIPGFAGTDKYTAFYGESFEPMEGGFEGEASLITAPDISEAKKSISENLKASGKEELKEVVPTDFIFIENGFLYEEREVECSHEPEDISENFICSLSADLTALVISKKHIREFAEETILSEIAEGSTFQAESIIINYSFKSFEKENGRMEIGLVIKAKTYPDIDAEILKQNIAGKTFEEAEFYLKENIEMARVEISKRFWGRKKIPGSINKIELDLLLD